MGGVQKTFKNIASDCQIGLKQFRRPGSVEHSGVVFSGFDRIVLEVTEIVKTPGGEEGTIERNLRQFNLGERMNAQ